MFGAIAGGIASALAGGAMSKLFGGGQKAASGGIQGDVLATDNNTVGRHPRRFKIVVIDIQITLKQMLRDFIGIRVNRAKKSGMVNITSSVNSRERSGINTILHELNPLFTINVTMRDIKSKNV